MATRRQCLLLYKRAVGEPTPGDEGAGTCLGRAQVAPEPEAMFRVNCFAPFRFAFQYIRHNPN